MAIARKQILLCLVFCATFGLSIIFGINPASVRAPEPQVRIETSPNQLAQHKNHNKPFYASYHQRFKLVTALQYKKKLNAVYQSKVLTHLNHQTHAYLAIKAANVLLNNIIVNIDSTNDKIYSTPHF